MAAVLGGWNCAVEQFLGQLGLSPEWTDLLEYEERIEDAEAVHAPIRGNVPVRYYSICDRPLFRVCCMPSHFNRDWLLYQAEFSDWAGMWAKKIYSKREKRI